MNSKLLKELEGVDYPLLTNCQLKFLKEANSLIELKVRNSTIEVEDRAYSPSGEGQIVPYKVSSLEKNFIIIIKNLKTGRFARKCFFKTYPIWKKVREDGIGELKGISESINTDRFNCNVSKLVGYVTSFVGGSVTLASAILIPFTFGLTTPLAIAGGSVTAAGCSAAIGTSVTEVVLLHKKVNRAKEIMEKDKKYFQKMNDWLDHAQELQKAVDEVLNISIVKNIAESVKKFVADALAIVNEYQRLDFMRAGINELFDFLPPDIQVVLPLRSIGVLIAILVSFYLLLQNSENRLVFDSVSLTMRALLGVASLLDDTMDIMRLTSLFTGSTVLAKDLAKAVTRGAVAVFGMALDVAAIALTSIDVHKGSISPEAEKITNACEEMQKELVLLENVYDNMDEYDSDYSSS